MTSHLGYGKHDPTGRDRGSSRNGVRAKTVISEVGPVELPRDRDASFEPVTVPKRVRRLCGVDEMVISLVARGMSTGDVQAHLAEVYDTNVSRQQISTITNVVVDKMAEWASRPLDSVYPVVFIDAINVKIRDGQVANGRSTWPWRSPATVSGTCSGCGPESTATARGQVLDEGVDAR